MSKKYQKTQKAVTDESKSTLQRYQSVIVGSRSLLYLFVFEVVTTLFGGFPGALGLLLRKKLYSILFKKVGRGVVFGRNITVRHAKKIEIADGAVIDDGCVLDARGKDNQGIRIGKNVILARNTILSCKDGDIVIGDNVGVGVNIVIQSIGGNTVTIGDNVLIAPFTYIIGGSNYHTERTDIPIAQQGLNLKGGIQIGDNAWLGARVTVVDGVTIGRDAIIGAGAVVLKSIDAYEVAAGVPARIVKKRSTNIT